MIHGAGAVTVHANCGVDACNLCRKRDGDDMQDAFTADLATGDVVCQECWTPEEIAAIEAAEDGSTVEVFREYSHGWDTPLVCERCHLAIPVYLDAKPSPDDAETQRVWDTMNIRWRARDDKEELYLRRCSELSAQQLLDELGVPRGILSLNGRLHHLRLRLETTTTDAKPVRVDLAADADLTALASALPVGAWVPATSGVSIDCGPIRLRCEGGSREEKVALVRFLKAVRDAMTRGAP